MNKWIISPSISRPLNRSVYGGLNDILTYIVQIHLDALFLFGSILLDLQVMWKKLFPSSQQEITRRDIFLPSQDYNTRSFTLRELRRYDGIQDSKVYFAVNGRVFDVTNTKDIQFVDGPFNSLAGRDASRALATFQPLNEQLNNLSEMDDLSDLNPLQMDSLFHCEMKYSEMYPCVGRLVRSHQPCALQHACIRTICATMGELKDPWRNKVVDELPLPKLVRKKIISSR